MSDIAKNVIITTGKVRNIYPAVEAAIHAYLSAIVQYNKTARTKDYAKWRQGTPIIPIVFASFEDDAPIATVVEF